ncbi:coagulation factor XII isoform X1 [Thamnophis elegans]|uniref:coagulation factor XII isoform X1 n=1 Tax=Thamnophis elegans TaxID=35005 RepID=UPI001379086A|nr:coagulation factor XII isoform X1 [Thamnophis elegans]
MTAQLLLLLLFVIYNPGELFLGVIGKPHKAKHEVTSSSEESCHFPFRYQRKMHYYCLPSDLLKSQRWCATTENYDRDQQWKFCQKEERPTGYCDPNPCQNGGVCEARKAGFHCTCTAGFHGRRCETEGCFGSQRGLHVGKKETWLQYFPSTGLKECRCNRKKILCKTVHGKACRSNPCLNGGQCIQLGQNLVCSCPEKFSGPLCDIDHTEICYSGNGHLYRGMAQSSSSGAPCLPWDSPILLMEYSIKLRNAVSLGLGEHAFCRNPDNDTQPWCFLLQDRRITWEYCNITRCHPQSTGELITKATGAPLEEMATSSHVNSKPKSTTSSAPVCGQRYTKVISSRSRIVGGVVALPGAHPYLAALYIGEQFCGGSLIDSCWILTAAHCLEFRPDVSRISVVLGQIFYNTSTEGTVKFQVQKYQLHENYSQITEEHDIALVQLKEKSPGRCIGFSNSISPICLPGSLETADSNGSCQIVGWGHMYEGADKFSVYLQEADVPIIPREQCRSPDVHGSHITQHMLCAGYLEGRIDACQGDSGGPLVCEERGKATIRGIVSWSTGCAQRNKPGVYTNVARYLSWIQSNMH